MTWHKRLKKHWPIIYATTYWLKPTVVSATTRNNQWCSLPGCWFCWERRLRESSMFPPHSPCGFPTCSYSPVATHAIRLLVFLVYSVGMPRWSSLLITKKQLTPSSDKLCIDRVFSSFLKIKKKLLRLQAFAKSQNWPACWTSFFENKIGYFLKFLLDTFLPFIQFKEWGFLLIVCKVEIVW